MKKIITTAIALATGFSVNAQLGIQDSVFLGPGYMNEVYYNTQTLNKITVPKNNWELGFQNNLMQGGIIVNHTYGVSVYHCPTTDIAGFATLDTAGLSTWPQLFNSDTTWNYGALNGTRNLTNPFDFGWGTYDFVTHFVTGDSVFVIKLVTGPPGPGQTTEFRKLYVSTKSFTGDYIFRYANLDNTNDVTDTILQADYIGKNFGYYSLRNNVQLDREPLNTDWDILFTRYYENIFPIGFYPVAGILSNVGVQVAQASGVDVLYVDSLNYTNAYTMKISEIGSDWKAFDQGTNSWIIQDSLCYFVKNNSGQIVKMTFTGFGGSANGKIEFYTTATPTAVSELNNAQLNSMALFPNTAKDNTTLVFSSKSNQNYEATITNLKGQQVAHYTFKACAGLNQKQIDVSGLNSGLYFVTLSNGAEALSQKLIVQ
jgi:hypothetical protein